jgi:hypothetical protein
LALSPSRAWAQVDTITQLAAQTATTLETGVSHHKRRLHKAHYFRELLASNQEVMLEASRA